MSEGGNRMGNRYISINSSIIMDIHHFVVVAELCSTPHAAGTPAGHRDMSSAHAKPINPPIEKPQVDIGYRIWSLSSITLSFVITGRLHFKFDRCSDGLFAEGQRQGSSWRPCTIIRGRDAIQQCEW